MAELSADEVRAVVGPVGDIIIAEIIATGITKQKLAAAWQRVRQDKREHDPGPTLEPGAFAEVVEILERLGHEGGLGDAGSRLE